MNRAAVVLALALVGCSAGASESAPPHFQRKCRRALSSALGAVPTVEVVCGCRLIEARGASPLVRSCELAESELAEP